MGSVNGKICCCCCCCSSESFRQYEPPTSGEGAAAVATGGGVIGGRVDFPIRHALAGSSVGSVTIPSCGLLLEYSALTQRGHYTDSPERENQDAFAVCTYLRDSVEAHLFGVFDGHGAFGASCARFVRDRLVDLLTLDPHLFKDPARSYRSAFLAVNSQLHDSPIDDSMSGTTAITVLLVGDTLYVANVGDSRAVAGVFKGDAVVAEDLSNDQTPFRKDEYERVRLCGARVLSVDQVEGAKDPGIQNWGNEEDDDGDPPRLWVQNGLYPGTAFTRSVGDSTAESIGVIAEPEVLTVKITSDHLFLVIASDGVFEFLSSQAVVDMVAKSTDPRDACAAVVAESYRLWLEHESRTDDITVIVVLIKDLVEETIEESSHLTIQKPLRATRSGDEVRKILDSETQHGRALTIQLSKIESHAAEKFPERSPRCVAPSLAQNCR